MISVYIFCFLILIGTILLLVSIRNMYKQQSERLDEEISNMQAYQNPNNYDTAKEKLELERDRTFDNIEEILEHIFNDHIITGAEEEDFTNHFCGIFNEVNLLVIR